MAQGYSFGCRSAARRTCLFARMSSWSAPARGPLTVRRQHRARAGV